VSWRPPGSRPHPALSPAGEERHKAHRRRAPTRLRGSPLETVYRDAGRPPSASTSTKKWRSGGARRARRARPSPIHPNETLLVERCPPSPPAGGGQPSGPLTHSRYTTGRAESSTQSSSLNERQAKGSSPPAPQDQVSSTRREARFTSRSGEPWSCNRVVSAAPDGVGKSRHPTVRTMCVFPSPGEGSTVSDRNDELQVLSTRTRSAMIARAASTGSIPSC
jgi:hypothetical protein